MQAVKKTEDKHYKETKITLTQVIYMKLKINPVEKQKKGKLHVTVAQTEKL